MSYNPVEDKFLLTNKDTGEFADNCADTTGTLLSKYETTMMHDSVFMTLHVHLLGG